MLHGGELQWLPVRVRDLPLFIILFGRNDGVTFRYGETMHGGELMATGGVL